MVDKSKSSKPVISTKEMSDKWGTSSLLGTSNYKTLKGEKYGYQTAILHLAPATLSGVNTCSSASKGCASACLNTSGLGCTSTVQNARINRTKFFNEDKEAFMLRLKKEIESKMKTAKNRGMTPVFRLNGTSDIRWERIEFDDGNGEKKTIFEYFPEVEFYDYTKVPNRDINPLPNYSLTFSRSEDNDKFVAQAMDRKQNVAVVFGKNQVPTKWTGPGGLTWKVIDGDDSDLRFLDPPKSVVGLSAKGQAIYDTTGFVLYGNGIIDTTNLEQYKKKALRDPSIIGQRRFDKGEDFVPIQSKVSKKVAEKTANLLRDGGRKARVIEHRPSIGGKTVTAYAVYTPGAYARTVNGSRVAMLRRAGGRIPRRG